MSAAHAPQFRVALRTDPENCTSAAAKIGADLDEAIASFRNAMPGCGLKLLVPPALPDGKAARVSLSSWRRGDQSAPVHSGVSLREALQQLFDCEAQSDRERRHRAACPRCRGIGWYITKNGIRAICTHS